MSIICIQNIYLDCHEQTLEYSHTLCSWDIEETRKMQITHFNLHSNFTPHLNALLTCHHEHTISCIDCLDIYLLLHKI